MFAFADVLNAAVESVNRTATVAVAGAVPVQVKLTFLLFPLVELDALTQVPEVVEIFQEVISAPPSASSA